MLQMANQKSRLYIFEIRTRYGQIMYLTAVKTLLSVFLNISTLEFGLTST